MTTHELQQANTRAGYHFFDRDTMRGFRSRIMGDTFTSANGLFVYFVTSERHIYAPAGIHEPRLYTVRALRVSIGDIETVGEFQAYRTRSGAMAAAARYAASRWQPINPEPEDGKGPKCGGKVDDGRACWRQATHANLSGEPFGPDSYRCARCLPRVA